MLVMDVNVMLTPTASISIAFAGMASQTRRYHTFDKFFNGYVRSECSEIIVLKQMKGIELINGDTYPKNMEFYNVK